MAIYHTPDPCCPSCQEPYGADDPRAGWCPPRLCARCETREALRHRRDHGPLDVDGFGGLRVKNNC